MVNVVSSVFGTCCKVCEHFTSLQFLVPMRRAMEQKLLKYVPCSTLNSDSSAPLHWTTQHACCSPSSSPGRSLVGVWHREFPSVSRTQTWGHRHRDTHLCHWLTESEQKVCCMFFLNYTHGATHTQQCTQHPTVICLCFLSSCTSAVLMQFILHWHTYYNFWMPFLCIWMCTQTHTKKGTQALI